MLQIAANWLEQEANDIAAAKEAYMAENCPAPDTSGDQAALMVKTNTHKMRRSESWRGEKKHVSVSPLRQEVCRKLHQVLDKLDEDRYDAEAKVAKTDKEVETAQLLNTEPRSVDVEINHSKNISLWSSKRQDLQEVSYWGAKEKINDFLIK